MLVGSGFAGPTKYHLRRFVTWSKETIDAEIERLFTGYGSKSEIRFS